MFSNKSTIKKGTQSKLTKHAVSSILGQCKNNITSTEFSEIQNIPSHYVMSAEKNGLNPRAKTFIPKCRDLYLDTNSVKSNCGSDMFPVFVFLFSV